MVSGSIGRKADGEIGMMRSATSGAHHDRNEKARGGQTMWHDRLMTRLKWVARLSAFAGGICLLLCVGLTTTDVVLRNFFGATIRGTTELTQLAVVWAAFLTIPLGFATGSHIAVTVFIKGMAPRPRRLLNGTNTLAGAVMMLAYLGWGGLQFLETVHSGERTSTIGVPLWLYWMPIIFGTALSVLCAAVATIGTYAGTFTAKQEIDL